MKNDDQNDDLGIPYSTKLPIGVSEKAATAQKATVQGSPWRKDDDGLGVPAPLVSARTLTDVERDSAALWHEAEHAECQERETSITLMPRVLQILGKAVSLAFVFAGCFCGLLLLGQLSLLFQAFASLPRNAQYAAWGTALILLFGILYVTTVLAVKVWKLRRSPQVAISSLANLRDRQSLRSLSEKRDQEAQQQLKEYLVSFKRDVGKRQYRTLGLKSEEITNLEKSIEMLMDEERARSAADWLEDFANQFQPVLDGCANRRVNSYSSKVCLATASSPIPWLDQMVICYASLALTKDLLSLYNLRPTYTQTAVVTAQALIHTYFGRFIEDGVKSAADGLAEQFSEHFETGVETGISAVSSSIAAKASEGVINALLVRRLGRRTITLLQPCRTKV